ncbi:hypothetical protein H2204_000453 [Knufia peltigerae]|uniref:AB hydrolase-1 domain-containing protein n=1 Tax=Knufia peltigerae TaxID=1002370 RepID=A0AA38YEP1_9EURO|nr:hypothetical protein H2204_000453 [Knufia peltigerae]
MHVWRRAIHLRSSLDTHASLWRRKRGVCFKTPIIQKAYGNSQSFSLQSIPAVLIPPAVFGGLLVTLWVYKCLMLVVFQNKIIYMPSIPPFSRSEKIGDYSSQCRPAIWTEHSLKSSDGTAIKLVEGSLSPLEETEAATEHIVVVYFQGNASSLPPRLPYLSHVLKDLARVPKQHRKYTIVALSYRGYWTSGGRPSQKGITLDAEAALRWVKARHGQARVVVWGQSIGAGVATVSLANSINGGNNVDNLSGLVLETPFVDLQAMLVALYPQKFLPYRYLGPFLRSTWDSGTALLQISAIKRDLNVLILEAGDDEIVPAGQAEILEEICAKQCLPVQRKIVAGSLHTEAITKRQGRQHVVGFLQSL